MVPRLLTRADDLGSFASATAAIEECIDAGTCKNVSVMAPCPEVEDAADMLADRDEVCFGLHATITCEWDQPRWGPCCDSSLVPDLLAEDSNFVANPSIIHERGAPWEQIRRELDAQFEKLSDLGFDLRYCDTHMPWDWMHPPGREDQRLQAKQQAWSQDKGLVYWQQFPFARHAGAFDLAALSQDQPTLWLQHPCYDDEEMRAVCPADREAGNEGVSRDQQRRHFLDAALFDAIAEGRVQLLRYDELL